MGSPSDGAGYAQKGRWAAFRAALMTDAAAQFEAPGGHVEQ